MERVDILQKFAVYLMCIMCNCHEDEWERIGEDARQSWLTDAQNTIDFLDNLRKAD